MVPIKKEASKKLCLFLVYSEIPFMMISTTSLKASG